MKADKREIVTFVIAALATLVAVWFFLGKMQKEKDTVRTDLYTLVAPASDAILSVNRPAAFTKYILSRDSERDAFASKIPDIYLSIIQNNRNIPWLLLSFHPQGVILYAQAGNNLVGRIEKNTLQKGFRSFAPQKQKGTASLLPITRIPETVFSVIINTRAYGWQVTARNYSKKSPKSNETGKVTCYPTKTACASHSTKTPL